MTLFRKSKSKGELQQDFQTTVRFLDDSEPIQLPFTKDTQGQFVLEKVCESLNLVEKDYFGLRYVDAEKQRHWLDPTKTVYKQLKGVSPCVLCFRVKFYPADPMKLHEEITRYYLFLQLRRDLHHGRLLCSPQDGNLLAAYIIQSEVGDYDPQDHPPGYVAEFKMLPNQNVQQEQQIAEIHKTLTGQVPAEAEANFLKKASTLDTYGVDPHKVKDQKGNQMYLGVTHQGIMTFHGSRRTQLYKWTQVKKLAFEGKTFIAHVNINEDSPPTHSKKKHQPIGYKCLTVSACKYLWRCAVEQQFFFTLQNSFHTPKVRSGGSLFSRGSKFRFSGRCQHEAYLASEDIKRKEPDFQRAHSLPTFARKSESMKVKSSTNDAINEDRGRRYKAETLPRMAPAVPTVTVESVTQEPELRRNSAGRDNRRGSREGRERKDSDSREKRRQERESAREAKRAEEDEKEKARISGESPSRSKEAEIGKENGMTTKIVAPQGVEAVEEVKKVVAEVTNEAQAKAVELETDFTEVVQTHVVSENAVDVGSASLASSPLVKAPIATSEDDSIIEEAVMPVSANRVEMVKQNGGIPIIVTSPTEPSMSDTSLTYDPQESLFEHEDDEKVSKSLEEQMADLEKEYEQMQEMNHVSPMNESPIEAAKVSKVESKPNNVSPTAKVVDKKASSSSCSCGRVFAYTLFSVFVTLTVSVCVVMFSDIEHPVVNEVRSHLTFLEPARDFVQDKYNELVNQL